MTVGSWIAGQITTPDTKDVFSVAIPTAGTYTFETSGVVGACGLGLELDTSISVQSAAGTHRRDERQRHHGDRSLLLARLGEPDARRVLHHGHAEHANRRQLYIGPWSLPPRSSVRNVSPPIPRTLGMTQRSEATHYAFVFPSRYFVIQPCTSPHHSRWFCGLPIQCPSSGKITSRLGTFMRCSDVNIDRSSVYGTR